MLSNMSGSNPSLQSPVIPGREHLNEALQGNSGTDSILS